MKTLIFTFLFLGIFSYAPCVHGQNNDDIPTAPPGYRRPANYNPAEHRFLYSLQELSDKYSEDMMQRAEKEYNRIVKINADGEWKPTLASLMRHKCPEWFEDAKFGMFIDWGPWSVGGWAHRPVEGAVYPDWYEHRINNNDDGGYIRRYHDKNWGEDFERDDLIPFFRAERYQPDELTDIALEAGMKYIVPFCKHHGGFCLWESSYTFRDAKDMAGKDLIAPLVASCRDKGLKFGFYFSVEEWEYPMLGYDNKMVTRMWGGIVDCLSPWYRDYSPEMETLISGKIAVRDFTKDYSIPQAVEFIDRYDPDILWYDGEWNTPIDLLGSYDISAYFYNHAKGREVAVNDRYGLLFAYNKGNHHFRDYIGDFYTSEYAYGKGYNGRISHPWEECRGISQSFGFNWEDTDNNVISSEKFIEMFLDIVSHGGNLLLIVNLDSQGALPEVQKKRLLDIGKWLRVNGEGIYGTRAYSTTQEGNIRYTRSKDGNTVYAFSLGYPDKGILELTAVQPAAGSEIHLLGYDKPLRWMVRNGKTVISLPSTLQKPANRPCEHAYCLKIHNVSIPASDNKK
jgi:alpha-L-fucosidase